MKRFSKRILGAVLTASLALSAGSTVCYAKAPAEALRFNPSQSREQEIAAELSTPDEGKITLAKGGKTEFSLLVPDSMGYHLQSAVEDFKAVFDKMTGADIEIVSFSNKKDGKYIKIDSASALARPADDKIYDGYTISVTDEAVDIIGTSESATANGIYGFLEEMGCIFLTPDDTYIPSFSDLYIEKETETYKPSMEWRDVYSYEAGQKNWSAKLKLNGITVTEDSEKTPEQKQYAGWGTWCHSCYSFLSPEEYFSEHPEYFSEVNGERVCEYEGNPAYLCLSNPEVLEIVKKSLGEKIKNSPETLYWDFSGSDNPSLAGCQCEKCVAADKAAGGTGMGTLLPFLNELARAYPDYYISTLAYLHTLKAPEGIKAEPNVVIKLCSMPGDQAYSYLEGGNYNSKVFKNQVIEWQKIADKIVVWDYVVNFKHLLLPFPNYSVQTDNQKFYEENNVTGIFHQASREQGGEMVYFRAYLLSQLMWQGSDADLEEIASRYLLHYYGAAAEPMARFMNTAAEKLYKSKNALGLYDGMAEQYRGYLSAESISEYEAIVNEALAAVKGDGKLTARVEQSKLSLEYAKALLPEISEEQRSEALGNVRNLCEKYGITKVGEMDTLEVFENEKLSEHLESARFAIKQRQKNIAVITASVAGGAILLGAGTAVAVTIIKKKKRGK